MAVFGINATDKEPTVGWSNIQPTIHPQNTLITLSLAAWRLAGKMVDDGKDWDDIARMQEIASKLEDLAHEECDCLPNHDCKLCKAVASLIYDEDYKESK